MSVRLFERCHVGGEFLRLAVRVARGPIVFSDQRIDVEWYPNAPPRNENDLVDEPDHFLLDDDLLLAVAIDHTLGACHLDLERLTQPRVVGAP